MTTVHLLTEPTVPPKPLFQPYDTLTAERLNSEFLFLEGIGRAATIAIRGPRSGLLWYSDAPPEPIKRSGNTWTIEKGTRLLLQSGAIVQFGQNYTHVLPNKATVIFKRSPTVPDESRERIHCELVSGHKSGDEVADALGWLHLSSKAGEDCKEDCVVLHVHLKATSGGEALRKKVIQDLQMMIQGDGNRPEIQADGDLCPHLKVHLAMFRRELQVAHDRIDSGGDYATVDEVVAIVRQAESATAGLACRDSRRSTPSSSSPHDIERWWKDVKTEINDSKSTIVNLHTPQEQVPPWGVQQLADVEVVQVREGCWNIAPGNLGANEQLWLVVPTQAAELQHRWSETDERGQAHELGGQWRKFKEESGIQLPPATRFVYPDSQMQGRPQVFRSQQ